MDFLPFLAAVISIYRPNTPVQSKEPFISKFLRSIMLARVTVTREGARYGLVDDNG